MKLQARRLSPVVMTVAALLAAGATAVAAATPSPYESVQNTIEGYWNVDDAARREGAQRAGRPELTPAAQAIQAAQPVRAATQVVGLNTYLCDINGVPNAYTTSEPWALVVGKDRVVQAAERTSLPPRHFYTDGRSWPDLSTMPRAINGYSIGRWEGADLVVETRKLPPGAAQGVIKGPNTVLTERFDLSPDGKRLTITVTFTDPDLLVKPYSYQVFYDRADEHTYAFGQFCDPNEDPAALVESPDQEGAAQ